MRSNLRVISGAFSHVLWPSFECIMEAIAGIIDMTTEHLHPLRKRCVWNVSISKVDGTLCLEFVCQHILSWKTLYLDSLLPDAAVESICKILTTCQLTFNTVTISPHPKWFTISFIFVEHSENIRNKIWKMFENAQVANNVFINIQQTILPTTEMLLKCYK